MALDHSTFLTNFNGGSVTVDAAAPNFNIATAGGSTYGGNVYGPAVALTDDVHVVEFRRNVIAAGWWDDDGTDAASNLYLLYDTAPADVAFRTASWAYQKPQLGTRYITIEFREIASRTPRVRLPDTDDVEMTVVTPFSASDFDGTALNTLVIDWSVAGEVTFTLTSESGAEFTLTSATTATTSEVVAEPSFVWHLHDYSAGNEETVSDFNIKLAIDPFTTFESDNKFNLTWSSEAGADTHELVVNGGPQVFAGFAFSSWSPADITTVLWLDAADESTITVDGDGFVSQWDDKSGNASHVAETTSGVQPVFNEVEAGIEFDGVDDRLSIASRLGFGSNPSILVMGVVTMLSVDDTNEAIVHIGGVETGALQICAGSDGWCWRFNNGNRIFGPVTTDKREIHAHGRDAGSTYGDSVFHLNGEAGTQTSASSTTTSPDGTGNLTIIGNGHDGTNQYTKPTHVIIHELLILPVNDSATREKVEGYFAHRWGLADRLVAGHPYKSAPP